MALADGRWLVVEMGETSGCLTVIDQDGTVRRALNTGRPNGLALDAGHHVLIAESRQRAVLKVDFDTLSTRASLPRDDALPAVVLATHDDRGRQMRFPNDLCVGPDGGIYVTDSGITLDTLRSGVQLRNDMDPALVDGRLYRLDPATRQVTTIDDGLGYLNGLSFGPDGDLYVNDTLSGNILRYRIGDTPGTFGAPTVFANVIARGATAPIVGPDGMAHDTDGNLYVAVFNQGEVVVLDPQGRWQERIATNGQQPTNVAFGHNERAIYVTERQTGSLQRSDVDAVGLLVPPSV